MSDPFGQIRPLKARFVKAAGDVGLDVILFGADPTDGADVVHAIFTADEETLEAPADQPVVDEAFNQVLADDARADLDNKAAAAAEDLRRRLADGRGLLG